MYTNIPKPSAQSYTKINKSPSNIPLYGSAIYGISKYGQTSSYTNIAKPVIPNYTKVVKPT